MARRRLWPMLGVVLTMAMAALACGGAATAVPDQAQAQSEAGSFAAGQTAAVETLVQTLQAEGVATEPLAADTATPTEPPAASPSPTSAPVSASLILPTVSAPAGETATVLRVIDGDTIEVRVNGEVQPVRYIGVNTPEKNERCGDEATVANAALVAGREVVLVKDVSERDRFARLLRYVYADGVFVNAELVAEGYAQAVVYPPDSRHYNEFRALEADAKRAGLGCHPTGVFEALAAGGAGGQAPTSTAAPQASATPFPSPAPTQAPELTQAPPPTQAPEPTASNCDPSYPTVCIPRYPPDLDCGQIGFRRFTVLPPDPHGFDGDGDGIGCESG